MDRLERAVKIFLVEKHAVVANTLRIQHHGSICPY